MNFLNSFCSIILSKNGDTYTRDQIPWFYNSVSRVYVSVKTAEIMQMEITLTPSYEDALRILSSGLLGISVSKKDEKPKDSGKNVVAKPTITNRPTVGAPSDKTVVSGATTGMTQVKIKLMRPGEKTYSNQDFETSEYCGVIYQPEVSIAGADITITLKGYGYSSMSTGPEYSVHIPEGEQTLLDVVKECLEYMDYDPSPEYLDESAKGKLGIKAPIRNARETLFKTMKWACDLAKCGFVESTKPFDGKRKMSFYDLSHSAFVSKEPKYTCVQWKQVDPKKGVIPLLDFKMASSTLLFLQGQAFGTYSKIIDPAAKTSENRTNTDSQTEDLKDQSSITKTNPNSKKSPGLFVSVADPSSQEETKTADSEFQKQVAKFQKFSFQIPGVPNIYVMDQVNLSIGNVAAFQGVCLVSAVSHTMDSSGWVTDLEATMIKSMDGKIEEKNEIVSNAPQAKSGSNISAVGLA
jgi:hypothetical protein